MQTYTLSLAILVSMTAAAFAGYAFPVEAENIAIDKFKTLNPSMEVDETNFLVDLSGRYSRCHRAARDGVRDSGRLEVKERTPEGKVVDGLVDTVRAPASDSASLTTYIQAALSRWVREDPYRSQVQQTNRHGCSIEPDCAGYAVIVCLFSNV